MILSVGIGGSKERHDCFIQNSKGEALTEIFTISNSLDRFYILLDKIQDCTSPLDKIRVWFDATGQYS